MAPRQEVGEHAKNGDGPLPYILSPLAIIMMSIGFLQEQSIVSRAGCVSLSVKFVPSHWRRPITSTFSQGNPSTPPKVSDTQEKDALPGSIGMKEVVFKPSTTERKWQTRNFAVQGHRVPKLLRISF